MGENLKFFDRCRGRVSYLQIKLFVVSDILLCKKSRFIGLRENLFLFMIFFFFCNVAFASFRGKARKTRVGRQKILYT